MAAEIVALSAKKARVVNRVVYSGRFERPTPAMEPLSTRRPCTARGPIGVDVPGRRRRISQRRSLLVADTARPASIPKDRFIAHNHVPAVVASGGNGAGGQLSVNPPGGP